MTIDFPEENSYRNPYLNEPERPIHAVCRLMQELPPDITNAGQLTQDQSQMAAAVAFYADVVCETVIGGLVEIGRLMHEPDAGHADGMPNLGRLIQHLSVEVQCMQAASADYRAASMEPCRQI
jgi:hypothetical protein